MVDFHVAGVQVQPQQNCCAFIRTKPTDNAAKLVHIKVRLVGLAAQFERFGLVMLVMLVVLVVLVVIMQHFQTLDIRACHAFYRRAIHALLVCQDTHVINYHFQWVIQAIQAIHAFSRLAQLVCYC